MALNKLTYVDNVTVIPASNLNEIQDAIIELEENSGNSVPTAVRSAILTLFEAGAYAETGLTDEIAVIESWASEVTSLTISPTTLSLSNNTPQTITATVVPSGSTVSWSSSDTSVATVVGGVVTGVSNGTCVITASAGGISKTCAVTVSGFATLESISAVYTQSGTVYDTDSLDSLKSDLVVTATYDDTSTETVPSADYVLSGTLEVGTSTITVVYGGKTTTFNVVVSEIPVPLNLNYPFSDITLSDGYIGDDGNVISADENKYLDEFVPAIGFWLITSSGTLYRNSNLYVRLAEYDSSKDFISRKAVNSPSTATVGDNNPAYIKMGFNNSGNVLANADRFVACNVLDTSICTIANKTIDSSGVVQDSSGQSISDFLPVNDGFMVCELANQYDSALVVFYDENQTLISRHAVTSTLTDKRLIIAVPNTAKYVRFRCNTTPNDVTYISYAK